MRKSCSCNFLWGLDTDREQCQKIRNALQTHSEFKSEILFYKKNGKSISLLIFL